ncbi:MAG TPA: hypothetical protein VJH75_03245, partial [Patescibacteria group bacterium]|nr:hypothetical protein [Patescibacteria group bacterium]
MRRRAVGVGGNLGLADGKRILAEQEKLSVEFQGSYIPLPGNVLRGPHGDLYVAYLRFVGGRWILSFNWLDNDWGGDGLFACSE